MTEQEFRQISMIAAIASNRLEGLETAPEMRTIMQRHADDEITKDEYVQLTKDYCAKLGDIA